MTFIAWFAVYWGLRMLSMRYIVIPMYGGFSEVRKEFSVGVRFVGFIIDWAVFLFIWNNCIR